MRRLLLTWQRYQADRGDRLAASVTFYWFLSLFPVLLLAIYAFRLVNGDTAVTDVRSALSGYLPQQLVDTISGVIGRDAGTAGVLGLIGLVLSGLGWIDSLRDAIRTVWHQPPLSGNLVVRKVRDLVGLIGLLATVSASVAVTTLVGSGPGWVLDQFAIDRTSALAITALRVTGLLLAGCADLALFLFLFHRLARLPAALPTLLGGAVFGAIGFAVLKLVGGFYVSHTTTKGEATYGAFAVVVGLLLFLNLVSRLVLLAAAFAAVASTASTQEVQAVERSWSPKHVSEPAPPPDRPAAATELPGTTQVVLAARAVTVASAAVVAAVGIYAIRTAARVLRPSGH